MSYYKIIYWKKTSISNTKHILVLKASSEEESRQILSDKMKMDSMVRECHISSVRLLQPEQNKIIFHSDVSFIDH